MLFKLKKLLFLLTVYVRGIKFYESCYTPKTSEFKEAIFVTVDDYLIKFTFYKETFENIKYIRNRVVKEKYVVFIVKTNFDNKLPNSLINFNNLKYVFTSTYMYDSNDEIIADILLYIYLKFIKHEITQQKK